MFVLDIGSHKSYIYRKIMLEAMSQVLPKTTPVVCRPMTASMAVLERLQLCKPVGTHCMA